MSGKHPTLDELRRSKAKTVRQVGIDSSLFSGITTGRRGLGPNGTRKIAEALGVTTDEVFAAYQETRRRLARKPRRHVQADPPAQPAQGVA